MYVQDANQGLQITVAGDRRITKAGSFLRKNKLDELPQLIDVFLGQMSLVGPRPEVPFYIQYYPLEVVTIIQSVKPGITDWASIKFHQENELLVDSTNPHQTYLDEILPTKIRYYVDYVHNQSFLGDMGILFCTLAIMVRMRRT
jgi:lipopolysaccharide/colanic/teichoic acid biosynthesis glycosyltransferase